MRRRSASSSGAIEPHQPLETGQRRERAAAARAGEAFGDRARAGLIEDAVDEAHPEQRPRGPLRPPGDLHRAVPCLYRKAVGRFLGQPAVILGKCIAMS